MGMGNCCREGNAEGRTEETPKDSRGRKKKQKKDGKGNEKMGRNGCSPTYQNIFPVNDAEWDNKMMTK